MSRHIRYESWRRARQTHYVAWLIHPEGYIQSFSFERSVAPAKLDELIALGYTPTLCPFRGNMDWLDQLRKAPTFAGFTCQKQLALTAAYGNLKLLPTNQ